MIDRLVRDLRHALRSLLVEIGVRIAPGAGKRTGGGEVVRRAMRPAVAGLAVGLLASLALTQTLQGLFYGLGPADPGSPDGSPHGQVAKAWVSWTGANCWPWGLV